MKLITKLTAIAALAAFTTTGLASGINWPAPASNMTPRVLVTPVAHMKCETMVIKTARGQQVVLCKDYAKIRPDDCRLSCANK